MVSAILAARHRIFVLVVTSLFVLFVFLCTINFFFFLLLFPGFSIFINHNMGSFSLSLKGTFEIFVQDVVCYPVVKLAQ